MPDNLDLSNAVFVPPAADKYVETVLGYWDYAFAMADKVDAMTPPDFDPEVEQAQDVLDKQYPQVSAAIDRIIIRRSLKRDLHG